MLFLLEADARCTMLYKVEGILKKWKNYFCKKLQHFFTFEEQQLFIRRWCALGPACRQLPQCLRVMACPCT